MADFKAWSHSVRKANFPYRQLFVLDNSRPKALHSRKEPLKSSKIPKFGRKML